MTTHVARRRRSGARICRAHDEPPLVAATIGGCRGSGLGRRVHDVEIFVLWPSAPADGDRVAAVAGADTPEALQDLSG